MKPVADHSLFAMPESVTQREEYRGVRDVCLMVDIPFFAISAHCDVKRDDKAF
jgi:hypothetical protein